MHELDRHLERQLRAQERQLVAVRLVLTVFAAALLFAFGGEVKARPLLYALLGAAVFYNVAIFTLISRFPAREVGIVATALDMVAVTVAVYAVPDASDTYLLYGLVVLTAAFRFGLGASLWAAFVCSFLYATVVLLLAATPNPEVQRLLPVRLAYLLGIGLASGLFARFVIGRAVEVAGLEAQIAEEDRERAIAREDRLLSQLAREFGSTLDRPATVAAVVRAAGEVIGDLAALWLVDETGERLELADAVARDPALAARLQELTAARPLRMGEGVVGRAAATATTVLSGPIPARAPDAESGGIGLLGLRSILAAPILGRGRVRGVLVCASVGAAPVGEAERRLAEKIAQRAGPALENAVLWADLQEQVQRERAAQRVKDNFLSIVSHELRTPLTSISGYAQLLERRVRDRGEGTKELEQVRVIRTQSGRMRRLVEDLLDVSRIDRRGGGVSVEPEPIDLAEELRGVVARTAREHADREIVLDVPEALPIEADRDRIGQVLTNLVDNAVKYSPEGGPVRVSASRDGDGVIVEVCDEGVGIPDDLRDRVFDIFFQAETDAQRRFGGLGLGLYISRAIVEAHGGRIWAERNAVAGHGTIMRVRLPVRAATHSLTPELAPGEPPPFVMRRPPADS
jgi:signal transduction histidine kinase